MKKHILKTTEINCDRRGRAAHLVLLCLFAFFMIAVSSGVGTAAASSSLSGFAQLKDKSGQAEEIISAALGDLDLEAENEAKLAAAEPMSKYTAQDLRYLACVIYCETEPLGYEARVALGNIVLNRVNSGGSWAHASTIKEVIYDKYGGYKQFDSAWGKKGKASMMDKAFKIYDSILSGDTKKYAGWQIKGMTECTEVAKDVMRGIKVVPDDFVYCRGKKYFEKDIETCRDKNRYYLIIESHIYYSHLKDY